MSDQFVVVEDGIVTGIFPSATADIKPDFSGYFLVPSFIDLQIYGANGKLFSMYPSPDTLQTMVAYCRVNGTSEIVVTVATNTEQVMLAAIDAVRAYWQSGGKGLIGLHLEGPWINSVRRGAHIESYIKRPEVESLKKMLSYGKDVIKIITLAPEICTDEVLSLIKSFNIVISAGHSNATYSEATASFSKGVTTVTHLFNAMSPFHHRDVGLAGAALAHPTVMSSIIADGIHVYYATLKIAKQVMGDRLFLITDAVTETTEGPYQHTYSDGRYLSAGTLSGSALTMLNAVKNCIHHCEIAEEEAFRMAALYPAKLMGLKYGHITLHEKASFLLLDEDLAITKMCM